MINHGDTIHHAFGQTDEIQSCLHSCISHSGNRE